MLVGEIEICVFAHFMQNSSASRLLFTKHEIPGFALMNYDYGSVVRLFKRAVLPLFTFKFP